MKTPGPFFYPAAPFYATAHQGSGIRCNTRIGLPGTALDGKISGHLAGNPPGIVTGPLIAGTARAIDGFNGHRLGISDQVRPRDWTQPVNCGKF
jgi:hypothetical protein